MVSIIIPNFNREALIAETLQSVASQSYTNWEAIIVDDGSSDGSEAIVMEFAKKDPRFRFLQRPRGPKGAQTCRNIGMTAANGAYIIFLDSDDLLAAHCLEQRVAIMNDHPDLDFAVFPIQCFRHVIGDQSRVWLYHSFPDYLSGFLFRPQWQTTCPIWRKEAVISFGGWDEKVLRWQDWDFHVRALAAKLKFKVFENSIDAYYRDGYRKKTVKKERIIETQENIAEMLSSIVIMLDSNKLLNDLHKQLMAANFLALAGTLNDIKEYERSLALWKKALMHNLISVETHKLGIVYLKVKRIPITRKKLESALLRKAFSIFFPKYIVCHY